MTVPCKRMHFTEQYISLNTVHVVIYAVRVRNHTTQERQPDPRTLCYVWRIAANTNTHMKPNPYASHPRAGRSVTAGECKPRITLLPSSIVN